MGLLRRAAMPKLPDSCQIALWKEAGGDRAVELMMPPDHHALLLTLSYKTETSFTIDGRRDVNRTVALSLSGLQPIKHPELPNWLGGAVLPAPALVGDDSKPVPGQKIKQQTKKSTKRNV
jgi:hypothetical protein